jgi:hypothetical protein
MKRILSIIFIIAISLFNNGCEEELTFSFNADFPIDFNIAIQESKTTGSFPFNDNGTINILENEEVLKYIERIKELEILQIVCTLNGIPTGERIITLSFAVQNTIFTVSLENLSENNTFVLPIDSNKLSALSTYLLDNQQILVNINGVSSYAPMELGVNLKFVSKIIATF